jgi:hypothetical protein
LTFGFVRNSVAFVLHEPVYLSMVGIKFYGNNWEGSKIKSLQIAINDGVPQEAAEPKFVFRDGSVLYLHFKQPAALKSLKLTNLNGGVSDYDAGISQIYFLRDKKLDKMLETK